MFALSRDLSRFAKWLWSRPLFWKRPVVRKIPVPFFDRHDLAVLRGWTQRMMHADDYLCQRLSEKRIQGLRAWEYGQLLALMAARCNSDSWDVLDVGPGNSTFQLFLRSRVRRLVTIDYPNPLEPPSAAHVRKSKEAGVQIMSGTMLALPFVPQSFDLVMCISAIEHLDDAGEGVQRPHEDFILLTIQGMKEMLRVVKPGGYLYLTSDAFVPGLQSIDEWSKKKSGNKIWSAYQMGDIDRAFLEPIRQMGFEILGADRYDDALLRKDARYSSYRGRYFTTFCIFVRRQ